MRAKEFNTNAVLEKCVNLFWKAGFGPCSVNDIVKETGVNRFSLYQEFSNKEGVLSNAIELYVKRYVEPRVLLLSYNGEKEEVLNNFFLSFLKEDANHPPGCFIVHVATEMADHNPEIKQHLDNHLEKIEKAFVNLFLRKNYQEKEAEFFARHFVTLFCYIMVFSVIRTPKEQNRVLVNEINLILNKKMTHVA